MKKLLLFLMLYLTLTNSALAGYSYYRTITVQSSQISGGSDLTQFPILVCGNGAAPCNGSIPGLKQSGGGAHVQNPNGYDIIFTSDIACTNKLAWEMDNYIPATGEFEAWVTNVSTALSHSSNTTFYMCYGNPAISSLQSPASSVWDSNYVGVWHLGSGSSVSTTDSIGNNTGSNHGSTAVVGQIGGAASFNGTSSYIQATNAIGTLSQYTASLWAYCTQASGLCGGMAFERINSAGDNPRAAVVQAAWVTDASGAYAYQNNTAFSANSWHYIVVTIDGTTNGGIVYFDGSSTNSSKLAYLTGPNNTTNEPFWFGSQAGTTNFFSGNIDEVRVSNNVRSADWIATEYNNQSAPSTFYMVGSETNNYTQSTIQGSSVIGGVSTVN